MRIDRNKLISQLKDRISERQADAVEGHAREVQEEQERQAAYADKTGADWKAYAERILQRVVAGQAVLEGDKPTALTREGAYRLRNVQQRSPGTADLERLVRLLEASPDETISFASLERAGFTLGKVLK